MATERIVIDLHVLRSAALQQRIRFCMRPREYKHIGIKMGNINMARTFVTSVTVAEILIIKLKEP
jgi:hypothetical protein